MIRQSEHLEPIDQRGSCVLDARDLIQKFSTGFRVQIDDISLTPGEIILLNSPSGSGKSTALAMLSGILAPTNRSGARLVLAGQTIDPANIGKKRPDPRVTGVVLQTGGLIASLSAQENVDLPMKLFGMKNDKGWQQHLFAILGISDLVSVSPRSLSVGQRQRVAIARAMNARPAILFMDEPVSALDPDNACQVEALIMHLTSEVGTAAVIASHTADNGFFCGLPAIQYEIGQDDAGHFCRFHHRRNIS